MEEMRRELAIIARSLRAYLEWQRDTGATGVPRAAARGRGESPASGIARKEAEPSPGSERASTAFRESEPESSGGPARALTAGHDSVSAASSIMRSPSDTMAATETERTSSAIAEPALPRPSNSSRAASAPPRSLDVVAQEVSGCTKCGLAKGRTQTVFARGNPQSKLCFIGEAPGAEEDAQGLPFVGRAGQLLDKMIGAMGLSPERDVYICNIIKCRPPDNRRPEPDEVAACIPYLHEQLAVVKPRVIVALGNTAVASLLGTKLGITKLRGQWKLYRTIPVMPTYHPSYLIRPSAQQAAAKREAWEDLQAVMKELGLELPKRNG